MQSNLNQLGLASFPNLENQPNPENGLGNNDENNNEPVLPPSEGEGREGGTSNDKDNPEPQPKPDDDASKNEEGKPNEEDLDDVDDNPDEEYYEEGEGVLEEPDPTEDENDSQGNFFEDNKGLLTRVHNILKLKFPNSNISLSQLLTGAQQYIDMIASNPKGGQGDGEDVLGERDEPESEIDISQFSDDDIDAIVNGFCKVYKTDWPEFLEVLTFYLNQNSFTQPEAKSFSFKYKKPDEQLDDIANPVNIAKYNEEFEKQNRLRISKLNNAVSYIIDSKPDNENEQKKKLVEFCLNDKTAVLDYIEYLLKVFYDTWLLPDGSGDRFPYVIDNNYTLDGKKIGNQDVGPRNGEYVSVAKPTSDQIKNSNIIKEEWNTRIKWNNGSETKICDMVKTIELYYNKDFYKNRYVSINGEKDGSDSVSITEYFNKKNKSSSTGNFIKINGKTYRNDVDLGIQWFKDAANDSSGRILTYDLQKYYTSGTYANSRGGKGCPEMMQNIAKELLKRFEALDNGENQSRLTSLKNFFANRYKKVYDSNGKRYRLKDYLHDFGIGMDCSGYVSRAIAFVMNKLEIPGWAQIKTLGPAYGRLKTNASTLEDCSPMLFFDQKHKEAYSKNKDKKYFKNSLFNQVFNLDEGKSIQPCDIVMKRSGGFHIRIVCEVDPNHAYFREQEAASGNSDDVETRIGIIQTTVVEKNTQNFEQYNNERIKTYNDNIAKTPYRFARPFAFNNEKKLIEYFKNMLIAKGKEPN